MFNRITFKKLRKNRRPDNITLINFLNDKSKYLKDEIVIGHCKGHDCIFLFFIFDGFYDIHKRLFPKKNFGR